MPTGTIDSAIFRDIFGNEAMRNVWSDGNRIQIIHHPPISQKT